MADVEAENPLHGQITCGSLLERLQQIWDEVGETEEERDKMLLQLEQDCLDVYKRKVDQAVKSRAHLLRTLADARVVLTNLLSALGEKTYIGIPEKTSGTIKEQLEAIVSALEKLWKQKDERIKEFYDVQSQIRKICAEIDGTSEQVGSPVVDESDLSTKKLDEFRAQLKDLQKEKSERLHRVLEFMSTVHDLCAVLGMDFLTTVTEVHPSLNDSRGTTQSKSISNDTLSRLANTVLTLKEDKKTRLHKLQELASQLIDLWNLMDTPPEERSLFDHVTCNMSASVDEVGVPGALASDLIEQAEVEAERLDRLRASRMGIAFKWETELEQGGFTHTAVSLADVSDPPAEEDEVEDVLAHATQGGHNEDGRGWRGGRTPQRLETIADIEQGPFSYSEEETLCLGRVWADTSVDTRTSNNQRGEALWVRIAKRYNAIRPQGTVFRSSEKLRNHWKRALADIKVFESCYLSCKRDLDSGESQKQIINAFAEFQGLNAKPFKHHTTWEKVRGTPKFLAVIASDNAVKRCKTSIDGSYIIESTPSTKMAGSAYFFACRPRPEGSKAVKVKATGKLKLSNSDDAISESAKLAHSAEFLSMYEIYTKDTSGMSPEVLKKHIEMVEFIRKKLGMQLPSGSED